MSNVKLQSGNREHNLRVEGVQFYLHSPEVSGEPPRRNSVALSIFTRIDRHRPQWHCQSRTVPPRSPRTHMYSQYQSQPHSVQVAPWPRTPSRSLACRGILRICAHVSNDIATTGEKSSQSGAHSQYRAHARMPDVVLRILHRHGLGSVDNSRLRRVIPRQARPRPDTSSRRNVDKAPTLALLLHMRDDGLARVINTPHIDIHALIEVCVRDVLCGLVAVCGAGVVDDDVAATVCVDGMF